MQHDNEILRKKHLISSNKQNLNEIPQISQPTRQQSAN
jgi:hypothetical protein